MAPAAGRCLTTHQSHQPRCRLRLCSPAVLGVTCSSRGCACTEAPRLTRSCSTCHAVAERLPDLQPCRRFCVMLMRAELMQPHWQPARLTITMAASLSGRASSMSAAKSLLGTMPAMHAPFKTLRFASLLQQLGRHAHLGESCCRSGRAVPQEVAPHQTPLLSWCAPVSMLPSCALANAQQHRRDLTSTYWLPACIISAASWTDTSLYSSSPPLLAISRVWSLLCGLAALRHCSCGHCLEQVCHLSSKAAVRWCLPAAALTGLLQVARPQPQGRKPAAACLHCRCSVPAALSIDETMCTHR